MTTNYLFVTFHKNMQKHLMVLAFVLLSKQSQDFLLFDNVMKIMFLFHIFFFFFLNGPNY